MENNFLKDFLSNGRQHLDTKKFDKAIWLVIGNASSELDSVVCSLVYGYYKQQVTDKYDVIPLISIPKNRVNTKMEVNIWMNKFNINLSTDLVYLEDIIPLMDQIFSRRNLIITLIGHQEPLSHEFNEFIKEVIDNRETNLEYIPNQLEMTNIQVVASCCTLIASYILNNEQLLHRNVLLNLLYGGMLLETECLCLNNGKTTEKDVLILNKIESILKLSKKNRMEIYSTINKAKYDLSNTLRFELVGAIKAIFPHLDDANRGKVIDAMLKVTVENEEIVFVQGNYAHDLYVIEKGKFEVLVKGKKDGEYSGSGSFGMYNTPRAATIIAKTNGILWAMDREMFQYFARKENEQIEVAAEENEQIEVAAEVENEQIEVAAEDDSAPNLDNTLEEGDNVGVLMPLERVKFEEIETNPQ